MMFMAVDLPEPDWPTMATNSPWSMVRLTPSRAWTVLVAHVVDLIDVFQFNQMLHGLSLPMTMSIMLEPG